MPGSGKGVLRIAIEDFLEGFDLGKLLTKWFVKWGEDQEDSIIDTFHDTLADIEATPGYPAEIKLSTNKKAGISLQGGITGLLGFGAQIGMSAASGFMSPIIRLINYKMDKKLRSARFDPQAATTIMRRYPLLKDAIEQDMAEQGWSAERITAWNALLTPKPGENEYLTMWLRGDYNDFQLDAKMREYGWNGDDISLLKKLKAVIPPVNDLISMAVREAFNDSIAQQFGYDAEFPGDVVQWAGKQGLSADWVKRYWRAHWQLPSPQMAYEMLHRLRPGISRNPFTVGDMQALLKTADYPAWFRQRLIDISYSPYTRVDVRRMYKLGILSVDQVKQSYLDLGYDDEKATNLTTFTVEQNSSDDETDVDKAKTLTTGMIREALRKGIISESEADNRLTEYYPDSNDRRVIITATLWQKVVTNVPDYLPELHREIKSAVEATYTARLTTHDDAMQDLAGIGVSEDMANSFLQWADYKYSHSIQSDKIQKIGEAYMNGAIEQSTAIAELGKLNITGALQSQIMDEWTPNMMVRSRRLSPTQYRDAYIAGIMNEAVYVKTLQQLGYTDTDISILKNLADMKIASNEEEG